MLLIGENKKLPAFWWLQIEGWAIYLVMIYITFLTVAPENFSLTLLQIKVVRTIIGFGLTCVLRQIYKRFGDQLAIQTTIALVLIFAVIFGSAWTLIEMLYVAQTTANFNLATSLARSPRNALDFAMTITAWSAIYFGIKYFYGWQRERENALGAIALANQAQLETLRYQINPHFLFNSLNSIRASIDEDAIRAKEMVLQLAEFLRYSLQSGNETEISLGEEIAAVRNYLAIEKTRFEEKLEVKFDVQEKTEDLTVPPFLLNPLIENAVKHGLNGSSQPLKIHISANLENSALLLEVANTGKLNNHISGTHIGLKNVRERLEKLFPGNGHLTLKEEGGWVRAQIRIERNKP